MAIETKLDEVPVGFAVDEQINLILADDQEPSTTALPVMISGEVSFAEGAKRAQERGLNAFIIEHGESSYLIGRARPRHVGFHRGKG